MSEFEKWWNANVTYTDARVRLPGAIDIWNAALEAAANAGRGCYTAEGWMDAISALKHTPEQSNES